LLALAGGPLLPRGYNASCPQALTWGKSGCAPEPALSLSKGLALFETWASTLPLWRAPPPVQTQRRRPLRARNDSGLLSLCCQGPQEATGRGGSHHLLHFSSQVTTLLTFALRVLSFLQICLCRAGGLLFPRGYNASCPQTLTWGKSGGRGWATLTGKYNAGLSSNIDRNNWGCATSRVFREVACRTADTFRLRFTLHPFSSQTPCVQHHRHPTARRRQWDRPVMSGPRCVRQPRRRSKRPQPHLSALFENTKLGAISGRQPAAEPPRKAKKRAKSLFRNTFHISPYS
jgi:hypothetical protein